MAPQLQGPRRGHLRILLAQRAGRAVARVRERSLLPLGELAVQPLERRDGEIDLPPDLQEPGRIVEPQPRRDLPDRADVRGHILAGGAVPARRGLDERPSIVGERDRHAVDLQLTAEPRALPDRPFHPRRPGTQVLGGEHVVEREHPRAVLYGREQLGGRGADPLGRALRGDQLGEALLQLHELADERIVVGVRDLGVVEHVVPVTVVVDLLAQLLDPQLRLREFASLTLGRRRRHSRASGRDLDAAGHADPPSVHDQAPQHVGKLLEVAQCLPQAVGLR